VDWTFGNMIWAMIAFFFWVTVVWMCVVVISDVFRREMSGWAKACWVVLVVFLPFIGSLIYVIARPSDAGRAGPWPSASHHRHRDHQAAEEIDKAAQLLDRGRITADEYERLKSQALAR
jgi:hypothetical protein